MSHYVSPYGYGPVLDSILDCIADRHDLTADQLNDRIGGAARFYLDHYAWDEIGPVVDHIQDQIDLSDLTTAEAE